MARMAMAEVISAAVSLEVQLMRLCEHGRSLAARPSVHRTLTCSRFGITLRCDALQINMSRVRSQ